MASSNTNVNYGSVPFAQQIAFFRRKLNVPTNHWADIYSKEHDWAFMVAGANRDALLGDFRSAIEKVIAEGGTLEQFRRDFDSIVASHGWDYKGGREWRSRVIYETNLFSSYNAGRQEQLSQYTKDIPYWRYRHSDAVENPRHEHLAWDGLTLPASDPWWKTHYPPNGWGCQCYVEGVTEDDLNDEGKEPDKAPPLNLQEQLVGVRHPDGPRSVMVPEGIDPGFEHAPGRSRLESMVPPERPEPPISGSAGGYGLPNQRAQSPLPLPLKVSARQILKPGLPDEQYARAFLEPFGATLEQPVIWRDVNGDVLAIGADLFITRKTGKLKADKNGRGPYMALLAKGLMEPDEIWVRMEYHEAQKKPMVRRRYLARFSVPGEDIPALAVFEWSQDGWSGITTYKSDQDIEDLRIGVRIYRREE